MTSAQPTNAEPASVADPCGLWVVMAVKFSRHHGRRERHRFICRPLLIIERLEGSPARPEERV